MSELDFRYARLRLVWTSVIIIVLIVSSSIVTTCILHEESSDCVEQALEIGEECVDKYGFGNADTLAACTLHMRSLHTLCQESTP